MDADIHIQRPEDWTDRLRLPEPHMRGDVNGDGIADLLLRVPHEAADGVEQAGQMGLFLGRSTWTTELGFDDADATFVGTSLYHSMGGADWLLVADVDGDGCDDIVTSNCYAPDGVWSGETFVLFGQDGAPRDGE